MRPEEQVFTALIQKLYDAGFDNGWAVLDGNLVLWEHDAEPPLPFIRPKPIDEVPTTGV
jgi:hypothetical protein